MHSSRNKAIVLRFLFYLKSHTCLLSINVKHWRRSFECQVAKLIMSYSLPQVGGHGGPVDMCLCCMSGPDSQVQVPISLPIIIHSVCQCEQQMFLFL